MNTSNSLCACVAWAVLTVDATGQVVPAPRYRADQILVKPRVKANGRANLHATMGGQVLRTFRQIPDLQVVKIPPGSRVEDVIRAYKQSGLVEYAEPDFTCTAGSAVTPNDPEFAKQWSLTQPTDADIDAPEAWYFRSSAEPIVVAVIPSRSLVKFCRAIS